MRNYEEELILNKDDDTKLLKIYKEYAKNEFFDDNFVRSHEIYERALKHFSNKRKIVYDILMTEINQYFFAEKNYNEGYDAFLSGIVKIDDITQDLLFYKSLYHLHFGCHYIEEDINGIHLKWLRDILDCIENKNLEKYSEIMMKIDEYKKLEPYETTILLAIKNDISEKISRKD